jgi:hypothetical protein
VGLARTVHAVDRHAADPAGRQVQDRFRYVLTGTHPVSEPGKRRISKIFAQSSNAFATGVRPAGMKHDLSSWPRLAIIAAVVVAFGAGVTSAAVIVGASDDTEEPPGTVGAHGISLVSYDTCDTALAELKERVLPHVGPYGLDVGGFAMDSGGVGAAEDGESAAGAGAPVPDSAPREGSKSAPEQSQEPDHSTTNTHEAGVDEPDLVKTDGKRVVSVADGVLRVVEVASRAQTATVTLEGGYPSQLLLAGDRALVMTTPVMAYDTPRVVPDEPVPAPGEPTPKAVPPDTVPYGSQLVLVDLAAGTVLGTLSVDGNYLDARQVGSVARVVVRSTPHMQFRYPDYDENPTTTLRQNRDIVANSTIGDWLPRYELTTGGATTSGQLTACSDVTHPADYTATGMLTVLTVDLQRDLGNGDPVTIVADGDTVYGTGTSLYVADDHVVHSMGDMVEVSPGATELYQFDISRPGKPVYVASGSAQGSLLNQYSLSEFDGHMRVATTVYGDQGSSKSVITVLRREGDELRQVGISEGLGVGERIYAVRYFGNTAYVVTFRQTDPLYTVDLSNPAAPKVTGELKITGYSAYLHPAGDGRLIGVGQEADEKGRVTGAQVSLFDTSNSAGAQRLAQYHLPYAWTEVEGDPHAFLYWPEKGLVVLPVSGGGAVEPDGPPEQFGGALVLRLKENTFEQAGMLSHVSEKYGNTPLVPRRAMVIGNELWTVSEAGMLVSDLDSLSQLAWLPFS